MTKAILSNKVCGFFDLVIMSSREAGNFNRNRKFGSIENCEIEGSESGFTLIEILVAFLIVVIAIIPLLALFVTGMNASRTNSFATEANSISSTNLEFDSSIPPSLIGYYTDEFSSADPFYPSAPGPAQTEFATLFGSLSFPTNISYGRTVELGTTSPGGQSQYDLIQPVKTHVIEGTTYYTYTFVTGVDSNSLAADTSTPISCAYRDITVSTYWNQWTQVETQSTEVYGAGSGITGQCTPPGGSTTPNAPTMVSATASTTSPSVDVTWQGADPNAGSYVVEWSTDSNFTTDVQTSPVLSPGLPAINPTNCVITSTNPCNFTYTISPLSYNSTYFVEIWSYSLDGTSASISSQINTLYPPSTLGGVTTIVAPDSLTSCYVSSIFASAIVPGSTTTPSGSPVPASNGELTGKLYLSPSGASSEDIYVGANISNSCQSSIGSQMYAGIQPYNSTSSTGGLQVPLNNHFSPGNSSNTSGVMYDIIPLSTSASAYAKAELYLITLDNGTGYDTPPAGLSLITTTFLICPYIPISDRAEATNKC